MRENTEKWMQLCAEAANEQDSQKLMKLIKQITALLDPKQERLTEKDSQVLAHANRCENAPDSVKPWGIWPELSHPLLSRVMTLLIAWKVARFPALVAT